MLKDDHGKDVKSKKTYVYIAFIDLEKAFDNVNREILFNIMKTVNIDIKNRRIIHKLYLNEKAVITDKRRKY